jgi:hypothetical protein
MHATFPQSQQPILLVSMFAARQMTKVEIAMLKTMCSTAKRTPPPLRHRPTVLNNCRSCRRRRQPSTLTNATIRQETAVVTKLLWLIGNRAIRPATNPIVESRAPAMTFHSVLSECAPFRFPKNRSMFQTSRTSPSSSLSSQSAAVGFETDCHASSSNFRQRRLGRMQLLHRLALDLPDELPSTTLSAPRSVFANETESQNYGVASRLCNTDDATAVADVPRVSEPVASSITSQSTTADCCNFDLRHAFRVGQDAVMATVDSPITRFYIAFVVIAAAFANVFDVQPSLLVLIVSLSSFVSFHLFRPRDSGALTSYHSR